MWSELAERLAGWSALDTWIALTGALAAMACALPGVFLVLRRQSMIGDALSHTVLLGIVGAYLAVHGLRSFGVLGPGSSTPHTALFVGAVLIGVLSSVLTEALQHFGRVESSAALGVVFTSLFALGLLLLRAFADSIHIDPDCVLYGQIETVWSGEPGIPGAVLATGGVLIAGLALVILFFKELQITTFDPALATTLGINARALHYALAAWTSITLTAVFESVGSILVIAMLIVPAASAYLLTTSLSGMLIVSLILAAISAVAGHLMAITLPALLFQRLGYPTVTDASTAGMIAFTSGMMFTLLMVFAPRTGVLSQILQRQRLALRIAREDVLGLMYRLEERSDGPTSREEIHRKLPGRRRELVAFVLWSLARRGQIRPDNAGYRLTSDGRTAAENVVRAHRLWESYLARHSTLPDDHLHDPAERVEHFLDPALQRQLAAELDQPPHDPHGSSIPPHADA